jgi:hypothetical protein
VTSLPRNPEDPNMTQVVVFDSSRSDAAMADSDFYDRLVEAHAVRAAPFDPSRMALVAKVSDAILRGAARSSSPAVTHFAFWTRASALQKMAKSFAARLPPGGLARPRGLVFHLPPQNVETVFLYSWIISYLTGNANVVRLPQEISPDMRAICDLFLDALKQEPVASQFFVHYPSSSNVSFAISAHSDVRVVWGGDAKIKAFGDVPLRRGGKSIWFGDRFSFSIMNGAKLGSLNDAERHDLARKLYNDVFVFDQMACSSPHVIYVVGDADQHLSGTQALLRTLGEVARAQGELPATGHVIRKMVEAFATAAKGDATAISWRDAELTTVIARDADRREQRVGGGFLRVHFIPSVLDVVPFVREHDQTVTHFGFGPAEIEAVARASANSGVSRWVTVGSALDFDYIWDGYDLPFELTSLVRTIV